MATEADAEIKAETEAAEEALLATEAEAAEAAIEMAPKDNAWVTQFTEAVQYTVPPPLDRSPRQSRGKSKATASEVACCATGAAPSCSADQGPNRGPSTDSVAVAMRAAAARVAAKRAATTSAEQASVEQARHSTRSGKGRGSVGGGKGAVPPPPPRTQLHAPRILPPPRVLPLSSPRANLKGPPLLPMRCSSPPPAMYRPPASAAARRGHSSLALPPQQRPRPRTATELRPVVLTTGGQPRLPRSTSASWFGGWNILGQCAAVGPFTEKNVPKNGSRNAPAPWFPLKSL